MTGAARLREALEEVGEALSMLSCPAYDGEGKCQSGCYQEPACITGQPHGGWLAMATAGLDSAFEALAAVPGSALRDVLERIAKRKPNQQDAAAAFYRCREDAREALAAVPEAPEPVYVYRAASECIKWNHRATADEARADLPEVADEPAARWVERRGPWERVEEGTER